MKQTRQGLLFRMNEGEPHVLFLQGLVTLLERVDLEHEEIQHVLEGLSLDVVILDEILESDEIVLEVQNAHVRVSLALTVSIQRLCELLAAP